MGISVCLAATASFYDGVALGLLFATLTALAWTMWPAIDGSFWSKFRGPHHLWRSSLRNDYQVTLTRQQSRALERRPPAAKPPQSKVLGAGRWVWVQTERLLLWPIRTLANLVLSSIALVAGIVAVNEFFDEAVPYIEPDQVSSTSWHDLPLKAKIDSRIFGAFDVHVLCAANEIGWKGNEVSKTFRGKGFINVDPIEGVIPPHGTISFSCNMAEANAVTPPGDPVAPVFRIELHLLMRYRSFLRPWGDKIILVPWQREITSARFTWREVSPGNYQWLEGEPHGQ